MDGIRSGFYMGYSAQVNTGFQTTTYSAGMAGYSNMGMTQTGYFQNVSSRIMFPGGGMTPPWMGTGGLRPPMPFPGPRPHPGPIGGLRPPIYRPYPRPRPFPGPIGGLRPPVIGRFPGPISRPLGGIAPPMLG